MLVTFLLILFSDYNELTSGARFYGKVHDYPPLRKTDIDLLSVKIPILDFEIVEHHSMAFPRIGEIRESQT